MELSHGSVALTDLSLFVLGVWENFFPTWTGVWTLLAGLLSLHVFCPILALMGSLFTRLPPKASRYTVRLSCGVEIN